MKKAAYLVVLVAAVTASFVIGSLTSQLGASVPENGRKIHHYACPMHPAYTSQHPGTAPCCGMAYEPVYEAAAPSPGASASAAGAVPVSPATQQLIGIKVEEVRKDSAAHSLRLFGRVLADERRVFALNSGIDGTIRDVSAVTTGSRVRRNQLLATYTAPEMLLAVQAYIVALDGLERRRTQGDREKEEGEDKIGQIVTSTPNGVVINAGASNYQQRIDRLHLLGMSDVQIDEIRRTRSVPPRINIFSPINGIVLARNVSAGRTFERGEEWFRIGDLRRVWVVADVFGSDVARVRPGMDARVTLPGTGETLPARVSDVPMQFNSDSRTRTVRLELDNPGEVLRPDMPVDVELAAPAQSGLVVPSEAVIDTGLRTTVFVEKSAGEFEPREVVTGWRRDGRIEILRGLSAGDRIVVSGTFLLDSDSRMRRTAAR